MKAHKLLYLLIPLVFLGCYKEKIITACMDKEASNYDFFAEENCCCTYKSKLTIWYDVGVRDSLIAMGIKALYFYQDGAWHAEGHTPLRTDTIAPPCGNEAVQGNSGLHLAGAGVSTFVDGGQTKTIKVGVYGSYSSSSFQMSKNVKLWEKSVTFQPKGCEFWQLSF